MQAHQLSGEGRRGALGYIDALMAILPPKDPTQKAVVTSVSMPKWMHERLTDLAAQRGYKLNGVVTRLLEWALQEIEREEKLAAAREEAETEAEKPRASKPKK